MYLKKSAEELSKKVQNQCSSKQLLRLAIGRLTQCGHCAADRKWKLLRELMLRKPQPVKLPKRAVAPKPVINLSSLNLYAPVRGWNDNQYLSKSFTANHCTPKYLVLISTKLVKRQHSSVPEHSLRCHKNIHLVIRSVSDTDAPQAAHFSAPWWVVRQRSLE